MGQLTVIGSTGGRRGVALPAIIAGAGKGARKRFLDFFTVNIRNPNTRAAYGRAAAAFLRWCDVRGIGALDQVEPVHVAEDIEGLGERMTRPRSSNISPVSACCSTGWSPARWFLLTRRTPSGGLGIRSARA